MSDLKTSLLVNRQVPEFVREEYPLFISFLQAYYEFLETKQGSENNDLTNQAKKLRDVSDVDASIDEFESNFFNTFASLIPRDAEVSKEFLIKNVLPLYLSKGNEEAFKFLFRLLFNDTVSIIEPRDNILRASDGKWVEENALLLETDIRSYYSGNGSNTSFSIVQEVDSNEIDVYVDGSLKTDGVDYYIQKESKKIVFVSAPVSNSTIEVYYSNFDIELLQNRKVTGLTSGATGIVERGVRRIITDQLNLGLPFELYIDRKTLVGSFENGEKVRTNIINGDGNLIDIEGDTFSILRSINVVDGGTNYNVGDPVIVLGGGAVDAATAEVERISDGFVSRIVINYGGAGFKPASLITRNVITDSTVITGAIDVVNTAHFTSNTFSITSDIIEDYENVVISDADYGFPSSISENVNTRIVDALTPLQVTGLGPMTNALIIFANTSTNTTFLDSQGAIYQAGSYFYDIKNFRSVGRIDIDNGGSGYKVGDEVIFGTNPTATYGYGAAAAVKTVDGSGSITKIEIQPPRVSGTANILNNSITITGTGTSFTSDFRVGDKIVIASQERFINAISSDTSATVNVAFNFVDGTTWANNRTVGSFTRGIVGGVNYVQNNFPSVTVSNQSGGSSAQIRITSLMGDGESLEALSDTIVGQILSIKVKNGGSGYQFIPQIDLQNYGDGNATANAQIGSSYTTFPGKWKTSDSILSSSERRLQGSNYYVDYAYVTSSLTEFTKYKQILKDLLHPAGFVNYSDVNRQYVVNSNTVTVSTQDGNTISGLVSVTNNSIFVTGTGTKFNVANSRGIISLGDSIAVNGEIRIINSIISNTNLSVTSAFTNTANSQTLIILS